jgi:Putative translation initiation inhibitor, yjgF family
MTIENIAYKPGSSFSPAKKIDFGDSYLIFVSGIQPPKGDNQNVITNDIAEQTKLVFEEINEILHQANASLDDVVKAVIYLTDINDLAVVSPIRDEYFKNSVPTSTLIEVNAMTRKGTKVEIEVTAIIEK